jgi:hypothetical protein
VSTQESLQQQLATQVDTNSLKAQSQQLELQRLTAELTKAQKQLEEAQHAVEAIADELQVGCVCVCVGRMVWQGAGGLVTPAARSGRSHGISWSFWYKMVSGRRLLSW